MAEELQLGLTPALHIMTEHALLMHVTKWAVFVCNQDPGGRGGIARVNPSPTYYDTAAVAAASLPSGLCLCVIRIQVAEEE